MPSFLDDEPTSDFLADPEDELNQFKVRPHPIGAGAQSTIREIIAQSQPRPAVSPESQTGGSPMLGSGGGDQPMAAPDELRQGLDKYRSAQAHTQNVASWQPKPEEPKWWQRLAAGAVGGAAGYVNAAGRTHVDPTAAIQGIQGVPKQQRKQAMWQSELGRAKAGESAAGQDLTAMEHVRQVESGEKTATANRKHLDAQSAREHAQADVLTTEGKRDPIIKLPDGALYDRNTGKIIREAQPKASAHNLQRVSVKRPGAENTEEAYADPRNPGRLLSLTGEEMPQGTVSVPASVASAQVRSDSYGEYGNYYRAAKGRGMGDAEARQTAGRMVFDRFGVTLGAREQDVAIKQELSGIGGGVSTPRTTSPAGQSSSAKPPAAPAAQARGPLDFTDNERSYVNQFLGQLLGTLPVGRGGSAGQIGVKRGMELIAKRAGIDPMSLQAGLVQDKAVAKQLAETVARTGAIQRLNNTLDKHGDILNTAAAKIPQTDIPFLNTPWQTLIREATGSPELKRYLIAINAVQREYAYLTAGGAQSKAMLPVTVTNTMDQLFQKNSTLAEIIAGVDQVRIEAHAETDAMNKTQKDLIDQLKGGTAGRAVDGRHEQPPPPASYKHIAQGANGHTIGSNDGKTWFDTQTGQPVK